MCKKKKKANEKILKNEKNQKQERKKEGKKRRRKAEKERKRKVHKVSKRMSAACVWKLQVLKFYFNNSDLRIGVLWGLLRRGFGS